MRYTFTAVFVDGEDGWIVGYIEELPGALTQGRTVEEAERRIHGAVKLILDANRKFTAAAFHDARVVHRLAITVGGSPLRRRGRGEA